MGFRLRSSSHVKPLSLSFPSCKMAVITVSRSYCDAHSEESLAHSKHSGSHGPLIDQDGRGHGGSGSGHYDGS